jgi:hypothetical protein
MATFNITGIDAAAKKNPDTFRTLRPAGAVELIKEHNDYDPYCVGVWFGGVRLGYVPGYKNAEGVYVGSDLQRRILKDGNTAAAVERFAYFDGEEWNEEGRGSLRSVTLNLDLPENEGGRVIGGKYQRVTSFIGYLNPYGAGDGLIRWAFDQSDTFDGYKAALNATAEAGTALHAAIESFFRGGAGKDLPEGLPPGFDRFRAKYDLEVIRMEERFFDNTLMVTGQPDWFGLVNGKLTVVDWKSSKKPSLKHELQLAIYAKNCQFDGQYAEQAMVVCWGSEQAQGFATRTINRAKIEQIYEGLKHLKQSMELCGCWVNKYWEEGSDEDTE